MLRLFVYCIVEEMSNIFDVAENKPLLQVEAELEPSPGPTANDLPGRRCAKYSCVASIYGRYQLVLKFSVEEV